MCISNVSEKKQCLAKSKKASAIFKYMKYYAVKFRFTSNTARGT